MPKALKKSASEKTIKKFPDGFYWGEKWDGTHFARPFELKYELAKCFNQKVYSLCKRSMVKI